MLQMYKGKKETGKESPLTRNDQSWHSEALVDMTYHSPLHRE